MGPRQSGCQTLLLFLTIRAWRWISSHHQAQRHCPHPLLGPHTLQTVHNPAGIPPHRIKALNEQENRMKIYNVYWRQTSNRTRMISKTALPKQQHTFPWWLVFKGRNQLNFHTPLGQPCAIYQYSAMEVESSLRVGFCAICYAPVSY